MSPLHLVVTDAAVANLILQDTDTWVKPKVGPPVNVIIGQSCTQARGKDAVRQRRVLATALRSPKEFEGYIVDASKKLVAHVAALLTAEGAANPTCIDLQPLLHQLSLDINVWTLFGRETVGIADFSRRSASSPSRGVHASLRFARPSEIPSPLPPAVPARPEKCRAGGPAPAGPRVPRAISGSGSPPPPARTAAAAAQVPRVLGLPPLQQRQPEPGRAPPGPPARADVSHTLSPSLSSFLSLSASSAPGWAPPGPPPPPPPAPYPSLTLRMYTGTRSRPSHRARASAAGSAGASAR